MAHYTFPPGASEVVSGVTIPEYVVEGGRAAYAYDDATTEGVMYTVPNLPSVTGAMTYEVIGYASGTTGSTTFNITPFSYTPSAAAGEGSWLTKPWGNTSSLSMGVGAGGYDLSQGTLAYTPVSAITGDYFAFKLERTAVGNSVSGDFRVVGVTLTF